MASPGWTSGSTSRRSKAARKRATVGDAAAPEWDRGLLGVVIRDPTITIDPKAVLNLESNVSRIRFQQLTDSG
jgi:hypothetical protein